MVSYIKLKLLWLLMSLRKYKMILNKVRTSAALFVQIQQSSFWVQVVCKWKVIAGLYWYESYMEKLVTVNVLTGIHISGWNCWWAMTLHYAGKGNSELFIVWEPLNRLWFESIFCKEILYVKIFVFTYFLRLRRSPVRYFARGSVSKIWHEFRKNTIFRANDHSSAKPEK